MELYGCSFAWTERLFFWWLCKKKENIYIRKKIDFLPPSAEATLITSQERKKKTKNKLDKYAQVHLKDRRLPDPAVPWIICTHELSDRDRHFDTASSFNFKWDTANVHCFFLSLSLYKRSSVICIFFFFRLFVAFACPSIVPFNELEGSHGDAREHRGRETQRGNAGRLLYANTPQQRRYNSLVIDV